MLEIFSRVGFPREILTDLGKQFISDCMEEVCLLTSISHLTTTPYHAQCNGLVERYNGTLKMMLKKMCEEQPTQWDRYISPLLFAYREAKQESLGFSPFEIIYGKSVRGPLTILKELWTKDVPQDEVKTTYQYVIDLNQRLEETMKLAQSELRKSQKKYRHYANQKTRDRQFKVGDKVLLLLPTDNNKLLMQWKGPYDVTEKVTNQDYRINMKGRSRLFHANMLKRYIQREEGNAVDVTNTQVDKVNTGLMTQVCVAVIDEEMAEDQQDNLQRNIKVDLPNIHAQESLDDIKINPELSESQKIELRNFVIECHN